MNVSKFVIRMFGIPQQITNLSEVEVELKNGAGINEVVAALRNKVPALEGPVILRGEDHITESYAFVINGQFQPDDGEIQIQNGDRIALVLLAVGG